jgi:hypothetical protein
MASDFLNLLDVAKSNGTDPVVGLIEENMAVSPEAQLFPARTIRGTSFRSIARINYPTVAFRAANVGVETIKSTYQNRIHECYYLDGQSQMDVAVAQADEMGEDHALAMEIDGVVKGALRTIGKQVWYGTSSSGDTAGFPGALQIHDTTNMVVDAGGTTASTGSSVYILALGPKLANLLFGNGTVLTSRPWTRNVATDSSAKNMSVWQSSVEGWLGLEWLNPLNCVVRIKKLTADSGKGLTDLLLADALAKFPVGVIPTHIFATRRSIAQLQKSRTVTLFGQGTGRPNQPAVAQRPVDYEGVPIIPTDNLLNTEELTS